MSDIQLQPLFDYLDERFNEQDERFIKLEQKVDTLQTSVDNLSRQVLSFQQEMAIMTMRVSRMDAWIQAASQKIGIPYNT